MLRSGVTNFYNADGLGSVTSLADSSGNLAQTFTFDSFGNRTASSGSLTNPIRYTGREFDAETNLYYYRARYYNPPTGRLFSEDPIRFEGGMNFYGYVLNDPIGMVDPSGLECNRPNFSTLWKNYPTPQTYPTKNPTSGQQTI